MPDQAHGLRALAGQARRDLELDHSVIVSPRRVARTIAVTSGKGGVGKTSFCANLALLLAQSGKRVIVLDADLGLANIHVLLGATPRLTLEHVLRGEKRLADVLYTGPAGIQVISGASGLPALADVSAEQRHQFVASLAELDSLADVILIDTGAGLSRNVLAFVLAVEEVVVLTTPEPTALTDAYATIKVITQDNPEANIRLLVNIAANRADADLAAERLKLVSKQFLNLDLDVLGYVPQDPSVGRAVRAQIPLALKYPDSPSARALRQIAESLGLGPARQAGARGFLNRMSHYLGTQA
jgi:flagellar biosynthesis protein FlhG